MNKFPLFKDEDLRAIVPLRSQLLKWIGNKQRFAAEITSYFPRTFNFYVEPFLGSGAILATLEPSKGLGSDSFAPLIEIWQTLKNSPETLIEWYSERWKLLENEDKIEIYEKIKKSYNSHPNGADLLFLCRACYGGVVRFRKIDGYMSTPCGIHRPITPKSFTRRVEEWKNRIKGCDFLVMDFEESMRRAKHGDLIYCDPPYSCSQSILYGAQEFKFDKLIRMIEQCKSKGVFVALSIDGSKKSGNQLCNIELPKGLFKRELLIHCGRSMLKRFQMNGHSLEKEVVKDRLLLTY